MGGEWSGSGWSRVCESQAQAQAQAQTQAKGSGGDR